MLSTTVGFSSALWSAAPLSRNEVNASIIYIDTITQSSPTINCVVSFFIVVRRVSTHLISLFAVSFFVVLCVAIVVLCLNVCVVSMCRRVGSSYLSLSFQKLSILVKM